ncbi:MAG: hypothetical protein V1904_06940 [Bacteroidota bacterium]
MKNYKMLSCFKNESASMIYTRFVRMFTVVTFIIALLSVYAVAKDVPVTDKTVQQWMQSEPVQFLENKGQMTDMDGNPVPFVLFKAEAPGMDMYITEKGLTYVFIKAEEEKKRTRKEIGRKKNARTRRREHKNRMEPR